MLNGLCSAGSRLSQSLGILVQDTSSPCHAIASQCHATWEELVKATAMASSAVKTQVVAALQEINTATETEVDTPRILDSNQQVVCGSLMTFINLQYQFCVACCEFFGAMASSNCCQTGELTPSRHDPDCSVGVLQQCFARLYSPVPPPTTPGSHRPVRSPLHFPLCSLQGPQRRWSEAAAAEMGGESNDSTMRRWSMPWESSRLAESHTAWHGRLNPTSKLAVPSTSSQDRSRSTTPDSVWHTSLASQEELQEVIQLLSCRPGFSHSTQLYHPSQHLPGVTLTSCSYDGPPSEGGAVEDRNASGSTRQGSNSPLQHTQQTSWHTHTSHSYTWSEPETQTPGSDRGYDLYPPTLDPATLASRKSSSSTDSSSSHSLHSRSTTGSEGGAEVRSHLYSMWSGNELTFMKLSESGEPAESSQVTPSNSQRFPHPETQHMFYSSSK
ncbi:uncharacterized protein [Anabrus simplex]